MRPNAAAALVLLVLLIHPQAVERSGGSFSDTCGNDLRRNQGGGCAGERHRQIIQRHTAP